MRCIEMRINIGKKELVGLITEQEGGSIFFEYSDNWVQSGFYIDPLIPLGFKGILNNIQIEGLTDRLPSVDNPRYEELCSAWGISKDEKDLLILLSTLGHKSASSIEFFPVGFRPGIWKQILK